MKTLALLALLALLSACAGSPVVRSSFNGVNYTSPPTSFQDPRMLQRSFYLDDADGGWWTHATTPGTR